MPEYTRRSLRPQDYERELVPPPESIRMRWLELMQRLHIDWRTLVDLPEPERQFRRHIVRWVMGDPAGGGARRSLPAGIVVHAWIPGDDPEHIVLMRTR
jgi:hypothetical protein